MWGPVTSDQFGKLALIRHDWKKYFELPHGAKNLEFRNPRPENLQSVFTR